MRKFQTLEVNNDFESFDLDDGFGDYSYQIHWNRISSKEDFGHWMMHLIEKRWFSPIHAHELTQAVYEKFKGFH